MTNLLTKCFIDVKLSKDFIYIHMTLFDQLSTSHLILSPYSPPRHFRWKFTTGDIYIGAGVVRMIFSYGSNDAAFEA